MPTLVEPRLWAGVCLCALAPAPAWGITLQLVSQSEPFAGVTVSHYTTTSPDRHIRVAHVDLCADYVHVDATRAPSGLERTGTWASSEGVQLAVNGDFYKTGPVRVYGHAVGRGNPWPVPQTGNDPAYSWEWYYQRYGWIAFGHDWVEVNHTEWVKLNRQPTTGWRPAQVTATLPPGTLALVSGFAQLVVDGQPITCPSPTDSSCFPDRSDMRARHPRTAMGVTGDRRTFILAVVDGRTTTSKGMYGVELADLMSQMGADFAINLDGGGSSQMWLEGSGYVNDVSGNNYGNAARSVANHWGVFAGAASGMPRRPGHCSTRPACGDIGPGGGVVDDDSACFRLFGPSQYWREETSGFGGHLYWTNAFQSAQPSNWAWWQLHLGEAGAYLVEIYAQSQFAVYDAAPYTVSAGGTVATLSVDQSAGSGWLALGVFDFDRGGDQWLRVDDNSAGSVLANQHIVADAVRLTRAEPYCGDGLCNGDEVCDGCTDCGACPVAEPDGGPRGDAATEGNDAGAAGDGRVPGDDSRAGDPTAPRDGGRRSDSRSGSDARVASDTDTDTDTDNNTENAAPIRRGYGAAHASGCAATGPVLPGVMAVGLRRRRRRATPERS